MKEGAHRGLLESGRDCKGRVSVYLNAKQIVYYSNLSPFHKLIIMRANN